MANVMQTTCFFVLMLLLHHGEQKVFMSPEKANSMIQRSKRANFILIEELQQGNLERECLEEVCSYEEARETFEDRENTNQFWKTYHGGRQCTTNPCLNKGDCKDTIRSYTCTCPEGYNGRNCEFAKNECHPNMNEGCQHFCHPNYGHDTFLCSCADGYTLGEDEKSCHPTGSFACGQEVKTESNVTTTDLHSNKTRIFPWEVLLVSADGEQFCSGVILDQSSVLTTAKCSKMHIPTYIYTGKNYLCKENEGQIFKVMDYHVHMRYLEKTGDNDIAMLKLQGTITYNNHILPICIPQKDFAENILIPSNSGIISVWKQSSDDDNLDLVSFDFPAKNTNKETCESALNITQTNRMFCGMSEDVMDTPMVDGGYFAVQHKGTWFLTGIMGPRNSAISHPNVFSFTKISRYIMWLKQINT
ncbi:vitamin K-dependent protein Z [Pelodytes ibericus]